MMHPPLSRCVLLGITLSVASGVCQPDSAFDPLSPPPGELMLTPKLRCADLRSLTGYEFTVAIASLVPAGPDAPEYCHVSGQVLPQVRFEVNLPASWNRRLHMAGNGGYAGNDLDAPQRASGRAVDMRRGFVFAATNTGHDAVEEPLASFAQDRQKLLDYAFRSLHVTAETAKKIALAYYGARPARSYFEGCSTGGRQALILAQRFPEDFDGIVVGAPVLNFTGTMISFTCTVQALAAGPIPYDKLPKLAELIYAQCDAKDGLKDGLIEDPRKCGFVPSRDLPKCADSAGKPDCFTTAEIGTLEKFYGDIVSGGRRIFPGWPVGMEVVAASGKSGWDNWIMRQDGGQSSGARLSESFFRYMASSKPDPAWTFARFDLNKDPARLGWISAVLDATDPDLTRFKSHGGKLLMYHGWADPALNARMSIEYYDQATARMGPSTPDFYRLFLVPGMFHCGGGVGVSTFDKLTPLIQWVERGTAPDRILASRVEAGKTLRTRPLCPYPQVARYKGSGSIDDAANFTCAAPPE